MTHYAKVTSCACLTCLIASMCINNTGLLAKKNLCTLNCKIKNSVNPKNQISHNVYCKIFHFFFNTLLVEIKKVIVPSNKITQKMTIKST